MLLAMAVQFYAQQQKQMADKSSADTAQRVPATLPHAARL